MDRENMRILKRLQNTQSEYSISNWDRERRSVEKLIDMRKKQNYPEMSRGYLMKEIVGADTRFLNDSQLEKIKKNISSHRITPLRNVRDHQ
jgi:hypothetical protein